MAHAAVIENPVLALIPESIDGLRILDCAIGHGFWGHKIRIFKEGNPYLVGIDIWEPHITKQKSMGIYDELHVGDVRDMPFPDNSFDIVIACEILEHLEKEGATVFFSEIERVAVDLVIVSTPHGFMKQDILYDNVDEIHRSGWVPQELRDRGYSVSIYDDRMMTRIPKFVDTVRRRFFGFDLPLLMVGHKNVESYTSGKM